MSQLESAHSAMERMCAQAVDGLLARHRWQLLDRAEFARRALDHLRSGAAGDAQRAATHAYSLALHAACSGAEGFERQNRAYAELFRYLYDIALQRYLGAHEETAQRALARIYMTFERCRQPGAFLAFALQQLLDTARSLRRGAGEVELGELLADERHADPSDAVITGELRARFAQLADEFLRKHPRATRQFAALRLKFLDGLDDEAIAHQLGNSVRNIYVLRARAIEKLRAEPAWRALAIEFGILPDD
jgi:DNA-directed RNA polymerase specialized sigma24 family protein